MYKRKGSVINMAACVAGARVNRDHFRLIEKCINPKQNSIQRKREKIVAPKIA